VAIEERKKNPVLVAKIHHFAQPLKNILESAAMTWKRPWTEIDAFNQVTSARFHAVVSDVDMPRMNGFASPRKIRGDKSLLSCP